MIMRKTLDGKKGTYFLDAYTGLCGSWTVFNSWFCMLVKSKISMPSLNSKDMTRSINTLTMTNVETLSPFHECDGVVVVSIAAIQEGNQTVFHWLNGGHNVHEFTTCYMPGKGNTILALSKVCINTVNRQAQ